MRRTRSYAKFLAFALAVSLAFQSVPALAEEYVPINGTVPAGNGSSDTPAIAIGKDSDAQGESSIAIGSPYPIPGWTTTANGNYATAVGTAAEAEGLSSIALGATAAALEDYSVALGFDTDATAINSVAVGRQAKTYGSSSIAIGDNAKAHTDSSVAIGREAVVKEGTLASIALGAYSEATEDRVVSIGKSVGTKRRLVNMAAGQADNDAVNVAQLNETLDIFGTNADGNPIAEVNSADGTITKNGFTYRTDDPTTVQEAFTAIGGDIDDLDANAVRYTSRNSTEVLSLVGDGTNIAVSNVADGNITASSTYAVNGSQFYDLAESIANKLGVTYTDGETIGAFSVKINDTTYTNVADAIGALAEGWDINGTAGTGGAGTPGAGIGTGSGTVLPGGSLNVKPGNNIVVSVEDGAATGDANLNISVSDNPTFESVTAGSMEADTITATESVTVGTGDKQTVIDGTVGTVTVGDSSSGTYTEIGSGSLEVNTGNGNVHAGSNGFQVFDGADNNVTIGYDGSISVTNGSKNVTFADGKGTFTNANGTTSIDGQKGTFGSSGDQTVIDGGTVTVDNQITVGGTNGTVVDNDSFSINNNSAFFRENSMKVGSMTYDGLSNTLNMGGAGRLTGLADGGIYRGSTDAVTGNQLWDAYQRMDDLQEGINIVGAHAAALSGLHPIDYNPFEPTTLSAAVGTYRDEYAVAVGVFHYMRENVLFNLGASLCSDGDVMGRAGISFTVGRGGDKKKALAPKDMNEVQAQLAQVQQTLAELKAENEALKVKLEEK